MIQKLLAALILYVMVIVGLSSAAIAGTKLDDVTCFVDNDKLHLADKLIRCFQMHILPKIFYTKKELAHPYLWDGMVKYFHSTVLSRLLEDWSKYILPSAKILVDIDEDGQTEVIVWSEGLSPSAWGPKEFIVIFSVADKPQHWKIAALEILGDSQNTFSARPAIQVDEKGKSYWSYSRYRIPHGPSPRLGGVLSFACTSYNRLEDINSINCPGSDSFFNVVFFDTQRVAPPGFDGTSKFGMKVYRSDYPLTIDNKFTVKRDPRPCPGERVMSESGIYLCKLAGECQISIIVDIGGRLVGDYSFKTGTSVGFANGFGQVSYDREDAIIRSQVGDPVTICLINRPDNCPPGDDRGNDYETTNERTKETWVLGDTQHICGGG